MQQSELSFSVSDFVAVLNQTLEYAFSRVEIVGELTDFQVRKGRWVYFSLKDEYSIVKFFGTITQLPGPLEDGMMLKVVCRPQHHPLYGFTLNALTISVAGEGSIRRAADLLESKLQKEGIFDEERKRKLPFLPNRIGLITSCESAAYQDFMKVINARFGGVEILVVDVAVQGQAASEQIIEAIHLLNQTSPSPEVLVITRGGGSDEDLLAFNCEPLVRAIAASRIPTLVGVGHEINLSLSEKAADLRAATASNAAELVVPDRKSLDGELLALGKFFDQKIDNYLKIEAEQTLQVKTNIEHIFDTIIKNEETYINNQESLLSALSPAAVLQRGYALVEKDKKLIKQVKDIKADSLLKIIFWDGSIMARTDKIKVK